MSRRPRPSGDAFTRKRAALGGLVKAGADPERIAAARAELDAARPDHQVTILAAHIERVVAAAPPPSAEQIERLRALLPPAQTAPAATA